MRRISRPLLKLCGTLTVALIASWLFPQSAQAATNIVSLTAAPAVIDTGGTPGEEVKVSLKLTNNGHDVLPIHISTRDSQAKDGQSSDFVHSLSAKGWIESSEPDFILDAKQTRTIEVIILIPKDASPGGHYADLVVQPLSLKTDSDFIAAQPEITVQMFISVAGDIKEDLEVTNTGPSSVFLNRATPNTLSFVAENKGNIHTLFTPKLYLTNKKDTLEVESHPVILLPGEKSTITFEMPSTMQLRVYSSQVRFTYGTPAKDAVGPEMRVIVLPFSPSYLLIIPGLAIIAFAYRGRRRLASVVIAIRKGEATEPKK